MAFMVEAGIASRSEAGDPEHIGELPLGYDTVGLSEGGMNIEAATMKVPYVEALGQFEAYRKLVKETPKRATKDDVTLYRALWQITRGQKVIDINKAVQDAGLNAQGLPRIAVGRADRAHVRCWSFDGRVVFSHRQKPWNSSARLHRDDIALRMPNYQRHEGKAQTPSIPPQHRPKGSLAGYFILWEAEWEPKPPTDPLLLRRIDGPFFVVLAQWDLTPLEQAVLRQRL